jgi:predicted Fe-Mo cluster-binding NifX family protein
MKIVVPVGDDKKTIFKRTGQASFYNIYNDAQLIESVVNKHSHGGGHGHKHTHEHSHDDDHEHLNQHKKDIDALKGCDIILVQALGEHMKEALESIDLKVMKLRKDDGSDSDEVVGKYLSNDLLNQKK